MSQLQVQYKTALVNGGNRRRGDQDRGNGSDNLRKEYQSNRSSKGRMEGGAMQNMGHTSSNPSVSQAGSVSKDKAEAFTHGQSRGGSQAPWNQQHLRHLTACLVGQPVEVQVTCGSIYSGVFHTANAEKDQGLKLKMVRLIKDGSSKGKNDLARDSATRPQKEFFIHPNDVVQIIAKDVPLRVETLKNGRVREGGAEMVTDSVLSQGRHGDFERELKPWTPDADNYKNLGLESTFENTWNRNWDQFEINRTLFGVESTFDEALYTTKLEKGPQMREREREASRIAREIEGQSAKNLHLAEERGTPMRKDFDLLDEESRYSSVLRPTEDAGDENEDVNTDLHNGETFGNFENHAAAVTIAVDGELISLKKAREVESNKTDRPLSADSKKDPIVTSVGDTVENPHKKKSPHFGVGDRSNNKRSIRVGGFPSPRSSAPVGNTTGLQALNLDPGSPRVTEDVYRDFNEFRLQENAKRGGRHLREEQVNELKSFSKTLKDLTVIRQHTAVPSGSSTCKTAGACAPPASALPLPTSITNPIGTLSDLDTGLGHASLSCITPSCSDAESKKVVANEGDSASGAPQSEQITISSMSINSPISRMNSATSTTVLSSPSSSSDVSSSASFSKKSSLNPHAKEFKLNPNARSFTPNVAPLRLPSPVVQGSLYNPGMLPPGSPMQGVPPVGVPGNPQISPAGQPGTKYTPYNNVGAPGASGGVPFLPSPGTFTPVSGAPMPPLVGGGQTTVRMPPHLQQPATAHSYGLQRAVRYPPQTPSAYMHPSTHMYSQQMMFGQPGQVLYYQPYPPQGIPMPPPQPTSSSASQLQANHRGAGIQDMQMCVPPPYIAGQQHFLPPVQMPQLSSPMPPTAAPPSNTTPTTQSSQGVAGGMLPQQYQAPVERSPILR